MSEKTMTLWDLTEDNGLLTDGDWVESKDQDTNGTISLIQLADVKDGYFQRKSDRYLNEKTAKRLNCTFLEEGDVLVARLPDPLGRACIYPGDDHKAITAVDVCIIRIDKTKYNNRWLTHLINNPHFRREVNKYQSGTTRKRISKKNLAAIPFTIPEKEVQDNIADCVDTQFTRLDVAIKSLKSIKAKLELYRKSVLKLAFAGNLTNYSVSGVVRIGDIADLRSGTGFPEVHQNKHGLDYGFYKVGDISRAWLAKSNYLLEPEHEISKATLAQIKGKLIPDGSVVFAKIGEALKLNRRAITPCDCLVDNNVFALTPKKDLLNLMFLFYAYNRIG